MKCELFGLHLFIQKYIKNAVNTFNDLTTLQRCFKFFLRKFYSRFILLVVLFALLKSVISLLQA